MPFKECESLEHTEWPVSMLMLFNAPPENQIEILNHLLQRGFNIRQALSIKGSPQPDFELGLTLLILLHANNFDVILYLLNDQFVNLWDMCHFNLLIQRLTDTGNHEQIVKVIASDAFKSVLSAAQPDERRAFMKRVYELCNELT